MRPIQALFCDLDETLGSDNESSSLSLQQVIPIIRAKYPRLESEQIRHTYTRINSWHWEHFEESPIREIASEVRTRSIIFDVVFRELDIEDASFADEIAYEFEQWRMKTYRCYDDSIPVLRSLHGRIAIVLVTNGNSRMQRWKIEHCDFSPYLDAVFIAQELGFSKPSPFVFQRACKAVNVEPGSVLMVGDSLEKDVQGAQNAGCRAAWMVRNGAASISPDPKPDFIVHGMIEVKNIIERSIS
ncbi:MAG: HAD family hydrolase [Candidatus Omnitrophota bacterium]|jgi:HAD superfamily hydrolase (TIGR01549 family)|nr:MAG: HAD family hydrolase [Candidatus Omnitrophota bacterium]